VPVRRACLGLPLAGAWFGCPLQMRPFPPPSPSARSASSTIRRGLIRPGHGSGSLMPLPIPCALAAWCLSPQPSKGRWSSRSSAGRSPSGSSEPQLPLSPRSAPLPQAPPWSAPRQGSGPGSPPFDLRRCCAERGGGEPLSGGTEPSGVLRCVRHGSLRPSGSPPPVVWRSVHKDPAPACGALGAVAL